VLPNGAANNSAAFGNADLAKVYAGLGEGQLAMKYVERAISLKPASKDAWDGPGYEYIRGKIAAGFDQKDLAISILTHLLTNSYRDPITPAWLRLDSPRCASAIQIVRPLMAIALDTFPC
jgi:hypothetical protein